MTTLGYINTTAEPVQVNNFLKPFGLTYSTNPANVSLLWGVYLMNVSAGELVTSAPIASVLTAGVNSLRVTRTDLVVGWANNSETTLPSDSSYFVNFAHKNGYTMGVATSVTPHLASSGRLLVWSDEWITYDSVWSDSTEQANVFWNNALAWLAGQSCAAGTPASLFPDPAKWYKIATKADPNQCLDVSGGNYSNNTVIDLMSKSNVNQEFKFEDAGNGYYTITSRGNPGYSIDMSGNFANGQTLKLWSTNTSNPNQQFKLVALTGGYYRLESSNSGYSIDNTGSTANGTVPHLWASDNNNDNQKWVITEVP
jgi:hypothetical protein